MALLTISNMTILVGTLRFFVLSLLSCHRPAYSKKIISFLSGNVPILLSTIDALNVPSGSNLLNTLVNEKIFLPSACGGGGSCGQCRVKKSPQAEVMLTDRKVHLTRKETLNGWHLVSAKLRLKTI